MSREQFYLNVKSLFGEANEFKKDYSNIRILFGKDKHEIKDNLKGSALVKLLNGFLNEFGLTLVNIKKSKTNRIYMLNVEKKYNKYVNTGIY